MSIRDDLVNKAIRYPGAVAIRFRILRLRLLGVRIGRNCWIKRVRIPRNPWDIAISDRVALDDEVVLLTTGPRNTKPKLMIGEGTYVNRFTMFDASETIEIGQRCLIGPFCYITDHDHGLGKGPIAEQPLVSHPVRVGNNVWIGAGAVLLKGVIIGDDAVIAAGSVVTRSVGPAEIVGGVPAEILKSRNTLDRPRNG